MVASFMDWFGLLWDGWMDGSMDGFAFAKRILFSWWFCHWQFCCGCCCCPFVRFAFAILFVTFLFSHPIRFVLFVFCNFLFPDCFVTVFSLFFWCCFCSMLTKLRQKSSHKFYIYFWFQFLALLPPSTLCCQTPRHTLSCDCFLLTIKDIVTYSILSVILEFTNQRRLKVNVGVGVEQICCQHKSLVTFLIHCTVVRIWFFRK